MLVVLLIIVITTVIGIWIWKASSHVGDITPAQRHFGKVVSQDKTLPKIIWTYWHDKQPPLVVSRCIDGWHRLNPEYQINLISAATIKDFIGQIPTNLQQHHVTKQADWLRLALLEKYGGVWLDSSIILTQPLSFWLDKPLQQSSFVGFYIERNCKDFTLPLLENWFIAAKPGDAFIKNWFRVFQTEVIEKGTESYLQKLKATNQFLSLTTNIETPDYHTMHVVAQQLLSEVGAAEQYDLTLWRAEDMAFRLHVASQWRRKRLYWRLLLLKCPSVMPPLIKLRGGERRKLEPYLQHAWFRRNSIAGQFLSEKILGEPASEQV
ncbi:MAG: hypothetical protein B7X50_04500 [Alishewanella sp. 34-51-39]|nr:MAG: hypothetical protein B7X50_04500 [Alishewanella sp. 34-51-39]